MGMFDYVKHEAPCYKCGATISSWQSKDGDCLMEMLTTDGVDNFYADCPKCRAWNEYSIEPPTERRFVLVKGRFPAREEGGE